MLRFLAGARGFCLLQSAQTSSSVGTTGRTFGIEQPVPEGGHFYQLPVLTRGVLCVLRDIEAHSRNNYCHGKTISITYIVCVCVCVCVCMCVSEALVIQHAKRMCRIILPYVACPALSYFSALSHKRVYFQKKCIEYNIQVLIFSVSCLKYFSFQEEFSKRL
jgi:hypothetical protein